LLKQPEQVGVLIVVFAPLEAVFSDAPLNTAFVAALVFGRSTNP
jgi:hypothetical protein